MHKVCIANAISFYSLQIGTLSRLLQVKENNINRFVNKYRKSPRLSMIYNAKKSENVKEKL